MLSVAKPASFSFANTICCITSEQAETDIISFDTKAYRYRLLVMTRPRRVVERVDAEIDKRGVLSCEM